MDVDRHGLKRYGEDTKGEILQDGRIICVGREIYDLQGENKRDDRLRKMFYPFACVGGSMYTEPFVFWCGN